MHFLSFDFEKMPVACHQNSQLKLCAYTRCGPFVETPIMLPSNSTLAEQSIFLEKKLIKSAYSVCVASLWSHSCHFPVRRSPMFATNASDFEFCMKNRRCGAKAENFDTYTENCKCLTTGFNPTLTSKKQFTYTNNGVQENWGLTDCPFKNDRSQSQAAGQSSVNQDDLIIAAQLRTCENRNQNLRQHCDPNGFDIKKFDTD